MRDFIAQDEGEMAENDEDFTIDVVVPSSDEDETA